MNSNGLNHFFRIVWNASKGAWQAVSEIAKGQGKSKSCKAARPALTAGAFVLMGAAALTALGQAQAADVLPTGGTVTAGSASISTTTGAGASGAAMTITQTTAKMAADWQSFSIGAGNSVTFNQPSAASVALNRVLGADVSVIQGALKANGQVFLINPNGVLFTPTAQVNVGAMVASTLNMKTEDFMAGNYKFDSSLGNTIKGSAIINQGNITAVGDAGTGGTIALIAAKIINTGALTATRGNVLLGAGARVTLDMGGPVKLVVTQGAIDALIESGGAIKADGGVVLLTARAAGDLAATVINHTGIIEAQTLATGEKGEITLLGEGELITVSGKLDASAPNGGVGGRVVATGTRVLIDDGAHLTASGKTGGGEVLVGGSYQNSDTSVYQATGTIVKAGAKLEANATDSGNGGTVVAWSDITDSASVTRAYGTFEAKGGANGGDGGRMETSGHFLDVAGVKGDASAPKGKVGDWLFDPADIYFSTAAWDPGAGSWIDGGVTFANTVGTAVTNFNTSELSFLNSPGYTTTIYALNHIYINNNVSFSSTNKTIFKAGGSIFLNAGIQNSSYGTVELQYGQLSSSGKLTGSGSITLMGDGLLEIRGSTSYGKTADMTGAIHAGSINLYSSNFTVSNTVNLTDTYVSKKLTGDSNSTVYISTASGLSGVNLSGQAEFVLNQHATIGGLINAYKLNVQGNTATISGSGGNGGGTYLAVARSYSMPARISIILAPIIFRAV